MNETWEVLSRLDLDTRMKNFLASIDTADPRFLAVLMAILVFVGSKMVASQPGLKTLGLRLGLAMFLLYGCYLYWVVGRAENESLPLMALRAANAGGSVLALTWIVFPVIAFVYAHLRLALAAFLGYGCYAIAGAENFQSDQLPLIALHALGTVGLTLVIAWIVQPIWDYLKALLPQPPLTSTISEPLDRAARRAARRERRRLARTAAIRPELDADSSLDSSRRRAKSRLGVELSYALAGPEIGRRFSREMFDDFLHRYLGEHLPVEEVEDNARQFQAILQQNPPLPLLAKGSEGVVIYGTQVVSAGAHGNNGLPEFTSLDDLSHWFLSEQQRLVSLDAPARQSKIIDLHQKYLALANKLLHAQ